MKYRVVAGIDISWINTLTIERLQYVFLVMMVFAAAVIRFYRLGEWSLWIDEWYTLRVAEELVASQTVSLKLTNFLISQTIKFFGVSEWSLRLAPAVIGVFSPLILYFPLRRFYGVTVALLSTLFLVISPWHLFWSQNARFYVVLYLLYTLALLAFYKGFNSRHLGYLGIALALFFLAMQERLFAAFWLPVIVCYILLLDVLKFEVPRFLRKKRLLFFLVIPIVLYLIIDMFNLLTGEHSTLSVFVTRFIGFSNKDSFRFIASYVYRVGIPFILLGIWGGFLTFVKRDALGLLLLTSAIIPPLLLTIASPFVFTVDRYAFVSLPGWIILSALGIREALVQREIYGRAFALVVLGVVVMSMLSQNMLYYQYENGGRRDWKGAFALIESQIRIDDRVFATRPELGNYYLQRDVVWLNDMDVDLAQQSSVRSWFLISDEGVDPVLQNWIRHNSQLIEVFDVYIPGKVYDLRVYMYDPNLETIP